MRELTRFRQLSHRDRWFLFKTYALLTGVRLGLWLLPFERLCRVLENLSRSRADKRIGVEGQRFVRRAIWAVDASSKRMPGTVKCLARALTVKVLLNRARCDAKLVIGVAKNQFQKLEAHAWIEVQGRVVIGQLHDLERFTPLPTLPQF
jgi:hypothetical protein